MWIIFLKMSTRSKHNLVVRDVSRNVERWMADVGKVLSKQGRTKPDLGGLSVMDAGATKVQGSEPFVRECFPVVIEPHSSAHDKEAGLVAAGSQKVDYLTRFFLQVTFSFCLGHGCLRVHAAQIDAWLYASTSCPPGHLFTACICCGCRTGRKGTVPRKLSKNASDLKKVKAPVSHG